MVLLRQVWREQHDAREVNGPFGQHFEQNGELARHPRGPAAPLGFILREPELVHAIAHERRAGPLPIGASRVDLRQVGQYERRDFVFAADAALEIDQQGFVADFGELILCFHTRSIHPGFYRL